MRQPGCKNLLPELQKQSPAQSLLHKAQASRVVQNQLLLPILRFMSSSS